MRRLVTTDAELRDRGAVLPIVALSLVFLITMTGVHDRPGSCDAHQSRSSEGHGPHWHSISALPRWPTVEQIEGGDSTFQQQMLTSASRNTVRHHRLDQSATSWAPSTRSTVIPRDCTVRRCRTPSRSSPAMSSNISLPSETPLSKSAAGLASGNASVFRRTSRARRRPAIWRGAPPRPRRAAASTTSPTLRPTSSSGRSLPVPASMTRR